jgi:anti-anti-sigma regulatory factor
MNVDNDGEVQADWRRPGQARLVSVLRREGDKVILSLSGALDALSSPSLRPTVDALVAGADQPGDVGAAPATALVIDLSGLRLLDTAGVREVLRVLRAFAARGAPSQLTGAHEQPLALLKVLRLDRFFAG